jgi:NADPH-dependent curcumin reductase CurA
VGGDHLDAALACMNTLGRVAVCGMILGYNEPGARTVVRNLANIIYGRITLRGFTAADFFELRWSSCGIDPPRDGSPYAGTELAGCIAPQLGRVV